MLIKALVENTSIVENCKCQHGLSLYVETRTHKLLFDLGASNLFLENARIQNVDIADIDTVIISHGHYDHGGGLKAFLNANSKAKIYLHIKAFEKYYASRPDGTIEYIGLDEDIQDNERFVLVEDYLKLDDELELISNVKGNDLPSVSNKVLLMKKGNSLLEDTFEHEQSLIVTDNEKTVLFAGCAHKGIVNIVYHAIRIKGKPFDYVIGGFHLYNPNTKTSEQSNLIGQIGKQLKETESKYYTCHCTGLKAYTYLKKSMRDNIQYLATGSVVEI